MEPKSTQIEGTPSGRSTTQRNTVIAIGLVAAAVLAAGGYFFTKRDASPATQPSAPESAQTVQQLDLTPLQGLPPGNLLKDAVWGAKLNAIAPPAHQPCMASTLSQLPALQVSGASGAVSAASGSRAENWVTGYLQVTADGHADVILVCDDKTENLLHLTSRDVGTPLSAALVQWLEGRPGDLAVVTVQKGNELPQRTVAQVLGGGAAPTPVSTGAGTRVNVTAEQFQAQGGLLSVTTSDAGKQLLFKGQPIPKVQADLVDIVAAYRFNDRDVAFATYACGGSGCAYTAFAVIEILAGGQLQVFTNEQLTIGTDGAVPEIAAQPDGSLLISFDGQQGPQRWRYSAGTLSKV
jgi:hypothetical protein